MTNDRMKLLIIANPETAECARLREEADRLGHRADALPMRDMIFACSDGVVATTLDGRTLDDFDAIYLRNIFPYISEGLMLAEMARAAGLAVVDRCLATDNFIQSKTYNAWRLASAGITMPRGFQSADEAEVRRRLDESGFPVVVKGVHGSKGERVHLCDDAESVITVMRHSPDMPFIVEERLAIVHEYRVLTIGYRAVGAIEKHPAPGDFRRNLSLGGTAEPADPPDGIMDICERAAETLGYEFAGCDLAVLDDGRPVMLEVNRAPGFRGYEAAMGDNVAARFIRYLAEETAKGS